MWCIETCTPDHGMSKYMRLQAQSIKFESGRVYLPGGASWLEDYVREITGFPEPNMTIRLTQQPRPLEFLGRMAPWACSPRFRLGSFGYETC